MGGVLGLYSRLPLSVSASGWRVAAEWWGREGGTYQWLYDRGSLQRGRSDRAVLGGSKAGAGAGKIRFVACLGGAWWVVGWWRARAMGQSRGREVGSGSGQV